LPLFSTGAIMISGTSGEGTMALAEAETELRAWLDRLAIQDLINRYASAVTRADWEQCESVFAPDCVRESPALGMRFETPTAFVGMLANPSTAPELLIQTTSSPVIRLTGPDRAEATTTVHEVGRGQSMVESTYGEVGTPINIEQYGIYHDDVARIDGEWKFTHRLFVPIYIAKGGVTGDVITQRTALLRPK
jgi:hypothetical protein